MKNKTVFLAMSTPLASIFGSGFLVVVPVLASAVGPYSVFAMIAVALVAFWVGSIVRHNIQCAEPALILGSHKFTVFIERLSDLALVAAYVVSVCLYVHILSSFVLSGFDLDTDFNNSLLTSIVIGVIMVIGLFGGLKPLEKLESWALLLTIVILGLILLVFAIYDARQMFTLGTLRLPDLPQRSLWEVATIVAGTLIVVQGFETTRYLGNEFTAKTRIRASRWSQYFSLSLYVIFVALAQPVLPVLKGVYEDNSLITMAATAAFFLPFPLIVAAAMSQFSAAVADTLAAVSNIDEVSKHKFHINYWYGLVGLSAMALAWYGSTYQILALASRAFAFYYFLQCIVAFSVCQNHWQRARFIIIGIILLFVLIFAVPAG